jgi:hypothetical protein
VEQVQDGIVMLNFNIISCLCVILITAKKKGEMKAWVNVVAPHRIRSIVPNSSNPNVTLTLPSL